MRSFLQRYRHLHKHDLTVIALYTASGVAGAVLTLAQFADRTALHVVGAVIVVAGSTAAAVETLVRGGIERESEERLKRRRLASSVVEGYCEGAIRLMSNCPEQTGAIVFLPDEQEVLRTTFSFNKHGKPDANLSFRAFEGCTGHAWARGRQTYARLSEVSEVELEQTWKLTPEYIRLTEDLKVVVATPLRDPDDPDKLLGIVTLDSIAPDSECGLASEPSLNQALQFAELLAQILTLAEVV